MAIKKIKPKSPDPYLSKIKGDNTLARIGHVNQLVDQINSTSLIGPVGPQGVQGPTGPQGPIGPVGPAGLNWQGAWASGTSYVADDAVGYGGASYFCILATSGTTAPDVDTTHWALLASQGAQGATGPTGAQGPTGPQGPQGPSGSNPFTFEVLNVTGTNTVTATPITKTYTNVSFSTGNYVKLPASPAIGDTYYIANIDHNLNLKVVGSPNIIFSAGSSLGGSPYSAGNETNKVYVFQYIASGVWNTWKLNSSNGYKVYSAIMDISPTTPTVTELENTTGTSFSFSKPFAGQVYVTAAATGTFPATKTFICQTSVNNGGIPYFVIGTRGGFDPTTTIVYDFIKYDGTQTGWPNAQNVYIEIRVYN